MTGVGPLIVPASSVPVWLLQPMLSDAQLEPSMVAVDLSM
jgi:hypothetical protein